jgi:hypothetical protein
MSIYNQKDTSQCLFSQELWYIIQKNTLLDNSVLGWQIHLSLEYKASNSHLNISFQFHFNTIDTYFFIIFFKFAWQGPSYDIRLAVFTSRQASIQLKRAITEDPLGVRKLDPLYYAVLKYESRSSYSFWIMNFLVTGSFMTDWLTVIRTLGCLDKAKKGDNGRSPWG